MTSDIEWLLGPDGLKGFSWNPVTGCSPESAGCLNCYAAALAGRQMCDDHKGLTRSVKRRNERGRLVKLAVFNGALHQHPSRLEDPVRKRKGKRVFVNSMSDLFHEDLPFEFIAQVFNAMYRSPQHTFLVLTKRPWIALKFFNWLGRGRMEKIGMGAFDPWPLPNVQLGFSAEDQPNWNRRYRVMREVPAAVRWVSVEPQIGPVVADLAGIDWVVVGGESGPGARPFDVDWASSLIRQCDDEDVPIFIKQLGSRPIRNGRNVVLGDKKGKDANEWTGPLAHLRRREALSAPGKRFTLEAA
ncbi:MAG: phage Gp37/Gp68 family protein [Gammaproteobacteria bacterium]|nr:phage Gp37/Gp68 family protein [Gammaproteobacteria bacterium]